MDQRRQELDGQEPTETLVGVIARLAGDFLGALPAVAAQMLDDARRAFSGPGVRELICEIAATIDAELERYANNPRSFLYNEMLAGPAIYLVAKERIGDESLLLDGLEEVMLGEPLAARLPVAVAGSDHLSPAQRERCEQGFGFLFARRWTLACDLLLKGFEGAIWDRARALEVIDERRYLTDPDRRQLVKFPDRLIEEGRLGHFRSGFERFLEKEIFGAAGHDLRHARGGGEERSVALFSAIAIMAWLDRHDRAGLVRQLAEGLESYVESTSMAEAA